jgi:vancomycin resistance protein YoaR
MANATFKIENNKLTVVPEVIGRSIDKNELAACIKEIENKDDAEKVLPVKITQPEETSATIYSKLFKDQLGAMQTWFPSDNEINRDRAGNIRLAVSAINGKILLPGEVFSFNSTVGPRTKAGGYRDAYVYEYGKMVLGVGGGICQVSSTLYNAVLFADLQVIERNNHYFTISYVPLGRDAAVAYGSADFKFKNNTKYPIRIDAWTTKDNGLYFSLKGTNEHPNKTVEIVPRTIKKIDFKNVYTDDPNVNEGTETVKQAGSPGYVVETYVTVRENGKVLRSGKIFTSTYAPHDNEIIRGTKKVQTPAQSTTQPSKTSQAPPAPGNGGTANSTTKQ